MRQFTAAEKRREMQRELGYRRRVYAKMVADENMTQVESDRRIAIIEAIIRDYEQEEEREAPTFNFAELKEAT